MCVCVWCDVVWCVCVCCVCVYSVMVNAVKVCLGHIHVCSVFVHNYIVGLLWLTDAAQYIYFHSVKFEEGQYRPVTHKTGIQHTFAGQA